MKDNPGVRRRKELSESRDGVARKGLSDRIVTFNQEMQLTLIEPARGEQRK